VTAAAAAAITPKAPAPPKVAPAARPGPHAVGEVAKPPGNLAAKLAAAELRRPRIYAIPLSSLAGVENGIWNCRGAA
jgi:hypothetical protein